ncbi:MAG: hypothetical protein KDD43_15950, partial [Bdellovibrionales bacterium]|nr:hypothetical protein [Bdellovibrionales bacterium]
CGQVIRLVKFSMTSNKTVLDKEIGHCPGQGRRDGMAVILRHPKTQKYHMTFESLGGGEDQIVLMDSTDGVNWSNRRTMISEKALGAIAVGLPYLKSHQGQIILAATEVYSNHTKYRIRQLDEQGQKVQNTLTLDERKFNPGNLPAGALYWGNIEVIGDRVYGTGAALAGTPLTLFSRPLAKQSSTPPPSQVQLSWDKIETAEYSLDLLLKSGQMIGNCVNAYHMKMKTSHLFKGECPDNSIKEVDLSQVTHIYIHAALDGEWKNLAKRRKAVAPYSGQNQIHLRFQ